MQSLDGTLVFSATDLNNYLECGHLVALERAVASGLRVRPPRNATVEMIAAKGLLHEQRELERYRAAGSVAEIAQAANTLGAIERAAAETAAAMASGEPVIYQGTFFDGTFVGKADFLVRIERPSAQWPWSYEVADTKLALHDKPYFIIQLAHYSEHVARVQGTAPEYMHVVLGDGRRTRYRYDDFAAYYRHLKQSFLAGGAAADAYPFKCQHCGICDWAPECEKQRQDDDHLSLVAQMRRDAIRKLEGTGVATMAELARLGAPRPAGMHDESFTRLQRQAALQVRGRESGGYHYEFRRHRAAEGFGQLPPPAPGDAYFDMEGDPFVDIGTGLEYLFGVYCPEDEPPFRAFWGLDRGGEKRAFEACIDFLVARRRRFPAMHVYHYASYEKTALRSLAQRHATREDEVDYLLRGEVLVDLYAVVRQSLVVSQDSYSIKKLEPFYGMLRAAQVRKGDDSIVMFETYLNDPQQTDILEDIERYNEEDCRSTQLLHAWLLQRREEAQAVTGAALDFRALRDPNERCHPEPLDGCRSCTNRIKAEREEAQVSAVQRALLARPEAEAHLLAHVLAYHRREEKPGWWAFFDRCENIDDLLEHDKEALAGLVLDRDCVPYKHRPRDRNLVYTYTFPEQTYHLGDAPCDPRTQKAAGEIIDLDDDRNIIRLKRPGTLAEAEAVTALIPKGPIVADTQKASLARLAAEYLAGSTAVRHSAAFDLLARRLPRFSDRPRGARIQPANVSDESVYAAVRALDGSYLVVQGPPGTGKTHTGARVIARLLAAGNRVGVMSHGHKAIHNLLHEIERVTAGTQLRGLHKHSDTNDGSPYVSRDTSPWIESADDNAAAEAGNFALISGTGWLFARPNMVDRLDYLFIDEAGQTSLADALAVAPSARNLVLLGDPMQLAQVSQGAHPEGAGASVLEHVLGEAATIPENRGILLDTSFRMHPEICSFVSETVYDGRLKSAPETAANRVESAGLSGSGLRFLPVVHSGNGRESAEEAERIAREVGLLLAGGTFVRKGVGPAAVTPADVLVVAPFNAQRKKIANLLAAAGHGDVRVGTVDKFQGQEAPVVFYSMTTSSGDELPRNMEFLFEKNRFNVAVSRAQCLSVLVCSPKLLDIRCQSPEQIKLVNLICRYVERSPLAAAPMLMPA